MSNLLYSAIAAHLIGDFYLQPAAIAEGKKRNLWLLLPHWLLYALPFAVLYLLSDQNPQLPTLLTIAVASHLPVDFIKQLLARRVRKLEKSKRDFRSLNLFLADQFVHLAIIAVAAIALYERGLILEAAPWLAELAGRLQLNLYILVQAGLVGLIILKPASLIVSKVSTVYRPERSVEYADSTNQFHENRAGLFPQTDPAVKKPPDKPVEAIRGAGQMIGYLERILIVIFLSVGQYASIGLIMTAKSIARYERINKDSEFAEYYLIGTLSSILIAILAYLLVF
ncbi:MAG: DUF3307 domain-containing protein [Chloroflexi bacterium]|nr:DUF3307 domain-containing protein [Chloroflexota bacterium]